MRNRNESTLKRRENPVNHNIFTRLIFQIEAGQLEMLHYVACLEVAGVGWIIGFGNEGWLDCFHGRPIETGEELHFLYLFGRGALIGIHS